jgi:hypothetical protein
MLVSPFAAVLMLYDLRWIVMSLQRGVMPPWGTWVRITAALFCHTGSFILYRYQSEWPPQMLTFWLHMTLDPGLSLYAIGLWELYTRAAALGHSRSRPL